MILKRFSMAMLLTTGLATGAPSQELGYSNDSLDRVKEAITTRKAILVDVREKREWDRGHLQGAVLVPLSQLMSWEQNGMTPDEQATIRKALPPGSVVYCHCAAGGRARPGGEALRKLGYDARPLREGYRDLVASGFAASSK